MDAGQGKTGRTGKKSFQSRLGRKYSNIQPNVTSTEKIPLHANVTYPDVQSGLCHQEYDYGHIQGYIIIKG